MVLGSILGGAIILLIVKVAGQVALDSIVWDDYKRRTKHGVRRK